MGFFISFLGLLADQVVKYLDSNPVMTERAGWVYLLGLAGLVGWGRGMRGFYLILAGGLSNILDLLIYGAVRDMWTLHELHFNLADILIVSGVVWALVCYAEA